ncbi:MAG: histidine triad nucleotide-binding protein [Anaerovoracaceae bacterium]|jgi:diadenosine tetraphosphate (Ap4A) HIT family hydrolase|nr:histidine triad nucleotide-binding protein [Anaerovoracaceae bacterium]
MSLCIFCKITNKEIPASVVYEDDHILVFHDLQAQAPVHVLMISKKHIPSLNEVQEEDQELMGYMLLKVKDIAKQLELENGYRLVVNCGEDGLQTVQHIHFHILGKRKMGWPPG